MILIFFKVHNYCLGQPLSLVALGTTKPDYATALVFHLSLQVATEKSQTT